MANPSIRTRNLAPPTFAHVVVDSRKLEASVAARVLARQDKLSNRLVNKAVLWKLPARLRQQGLTAYATRFIIGAELVRARLACLVPILAQLHHIVR